MEFEIAARQWADEEGRRRRFRYFLTVEPVEAGRFFCENYGVRVAEEDGGEAVVSGVTTSASRIDELITMLVERQVGPAVLADVVADWL